MCSSDSDTARFELSSLGAIRHWLVAGPQCTPYAGPPGSDQELRTNSLDYTTSTPPPKGCLDDDGPYGLPWTYHDPGRNEFVEFSTFYTRPTVLNYWAFTEIMVPTEGDRTVRFWSAGAADLYVNGTHLKRLNITRYRNPDSALITLPLHAGLNRLCVRLQCLGMRDTRILFGLFVQQPGGIEVHMPRAAQIAEASRWIDSVRPSSPPILESNTPAPANAQVLASGNLPQTWPADSRTLTLLDRPYTLKVEVEVSGVTVCRNLEIPSNRPLI
ncbi:MAG: hypothetical protein PF795_03455, partial [Kiritimatiellae bacterium]|nr:hypothetical protein [Kiritimatiellia bacterium]